MMFTGNLKVLTDKLTEAIKSGEHTAPVFDLLPFDSTVLRMLTDKAPKQGKYITVSNMVYNAKAHKYSRIINAEHLAHARNTFIGYVKRYGRGEAVEEMIKQEWEWETLIRTFILSDEYIEACSVIRNTWSWDDEITHPTNFTGPHWVLPILAIPDHDGMDFIYHKTEEDRDAYIESLWAEREAHEAEMRADREDGSYDNDLSEEFPPEEDDLPF